MPANTIPATAWSSAGMFSTDSAMFCSSWVVVSSIGSLSVDVLIRLVDELGQGICWDTGHGNISMQPQAKALRKIGRRLRLVHINDNFGEDDVHLAPFLGKINWQEVMKALGEIRYEGSLNLEVSCKNMPETMRKAYANCLAASGRRLITMFEGKSDKAPYMA